MDGAISGVAAVSKENPASESVLSTRELEAEITELAGHLNAANRRWLALIAEFDRRKGWSDGLTRSCAHWLNWKCGIDMGAAREKIRVAHALESLPAIGAAMGRGELSYAKVRALTRVACPATEDLLLMVALHGTAHHVETLVRQFRRVQEVEELSREARQHANRRLTYFYDEDGSLVIKARLSAETGALVLNALEAAVSDLPLPDRLPPSHDCKDDVHVSAETFGEDRPTAATRRADALGMLAESFLKHGPEALSGGERHQIVVHVDAEALHARSAGRCELDDGPAIPVETARRLSCDASIVEIVEDEHGEPLDVGRKTRSIPPALRRALKSRDQGCVFPGCTHRRYVDGHSPLGRGRGYKIVQPRVALPLSPSRGARGRRHDPAPRRWRVALREAQRRVARILRAGALTAAWRLGPARRGACRTGNSHRREDSRNSLAR
jgi:hypothetical protein